MRVEVYIKQLLYRYDCVIVPNLGAFVVQKHSTKYHPEQHYFSPPSRTISFNKAIQNHDGLLAETIAKAEGMDFNSAKHKVQRFVNDFKSAIKVDKILEVPELGTFLLDEENNLSFEPNQATNFQLASFGLDNIQLSQLKETEPEEEKSLTTLASEVETTTETQPKPYLKYAAVGAIALCLAGFAGFYKYNDYVTSHNDAEAQKAETLIQKRIQSAKFSYTLPEFTIETTKIESSLPKYHIVAGAFRSPSNASKKVKLLKADGYDDAVMIGKNTYGLYQVVYSSFVKRQDALQQLRKIKANVSPEAWLYVKQL